MANPHFVYLGQASYLLMFIALLGWGPTWVRSFALASSVAAVVFCFKADKEMLFVPMAWNLAFASVCLLQTAVLGVRQHLDRLDPLEEFLKKTAFSQFSNEDLKAFVRIGIEGSIRPGQSLAEAGEPIKEIYCILHGSASYAVGSRRQALEPGKLIGEMALIGETHFKTTIAASTELKVFAWPYSTIEAWVGSNTRRLAALKGAVGAQLVERIVNGDQHETDNSEGRRAA